MTSVPEGPGAVAPFPAPPAEGGGSRVGWAVGIGAAAVLLCCGAGVAAIIGVAVTGVSALNEQGKVVVGEYLDALQDHNYDAAYDKLCDDEQKLVSKERFASREKAREQANGSLDSYEVGSVDPQSGKIAVTENYHRVGTRHTTYTLAADPTTGSLEVCGRD